MYNARIHPEQYSNTLSTVQISQLHQSIHYVCGLAVRTLADSNKFPEEWLFKHRWVKGKKDAPKTLPNGSKFVFLTVGGRTSAVVPSVQKKTGPVKKDIEVDGDTHDDGETGEEKDAEAPSKKGGKRKKAVDAEEDEQDEAETKPAAQKSKGQKSSVKKEAAHQKAPNADDDALKPDIEEHSGKAKSETNNGIMEIPERKKAKTQASPVMEESPGRRRSGRVKR